MIRREIVEYKGLVGSNLLQFYNNRVYNFSNFIFKNIIL